jgi:hypothetical protein
MRKPYLNIRCFAHPVILPQLFNRSRAFRLAKVSDQKMFDGLWFGESAKNKKNKINPKLTARSTKRNSNRPNSIPRIGKTYLKNNEKIKT